LTPKVHIATERLHLREWKAEDRAPFAALNRDPRVMEFFPRALEPPESDALANRIQASIAARGFGLYAAETRDTGAFIGFIGLAEVTFPAAFTPATEVGWRLARDAWGRGYATEGARAVIDHAFGALGFGALVSFTTEWNARSRRVMEKIGMTYDPSADFRHPQLPPDHKLAPHVLYRISREDWLRTPRPD